MIKKYGGYVLTVILSMIVGITGTYFIMKNNIKNTEVTKTISEVSITEENTIKSSIDKIYKATVLIESYQRGKVAGSGSGFIYKQDDKYGYVLTNNHVVESATNVKVINAEGVEVDAEVLGTDVYMDIAVLRISKDSILQVATIGDSSNSSLGDTVFTVGSPEGREFMGTVTKGILSGKDREVAVKLSNGSYIMSVLQTDAAINPGNSGGPLVNINGEVIGINSLKLVEDKIEGMGFAIPINSTTDITSQLIQYSKVKRPYIGISGLDLNEQTAKAYNLVLGVYVKTVEDFSAAEKAGIKPGDVIIEAEGKKITKMDELNEIKNTHKIGEELKIKVNRDGSEKDLTIVLGEQP